MTYDEFIKKPISKKVILFEIDKGIEFNNQYWVKHEPSIWKVTYTNEERILTSSYGFGAWGYFSYGASKYGLLPEEYTGREKVVRIGTFLVDGYGYLEVSSIDTLRVTDGSFFWDRDSQILYVNYKDDTKPTDYNNITVGVTRGYATVEGWYDGIFFEGRVKSIPNIANKKDPLFFGKISFDGGSVTLDNTDGHFDNLGDDDVYGQRVRIKFGSDEIDFSEYETVYSGFFESFNNTKDTCTINVKDPRKNISRSIPTNIFTIDDYPDLDSDDIGATIPAGYGNINKQIATCIDKTIDEKSVYNFKFVDTDFHPIQSIGDVYVEGKKVEVFSSDITSGTFQLKGYDASEEVYEVYEPGDDVFVSYVGYDITNPLDIMVDLLEEFTEIKYIEETFNIDEWEEVRASVPDILLSVSEPRKIIDIIGEISASLQGVFMFQGDGKITFRLRDIEKGSVNTIEVADQLLPTVEKNLSKEYTSSIRVGYNHTWEDEDNYSYLIDDSEEEDLFAKFRLRSQKEFKTLLTNEADAQVFANNIYDQYGGIFPTFIFQTKLQFLSLSLEDNIDAYVWFSKDRVRKYKLEVIGLDTNYTLGKQTITGRFIKESDDLPNPVEVIYNKDPEYTITFNKDPEYIITKEKKKLGNLPNPVEVVYDDNPEYIIIFVEDSKYIITEEED